jgi:hypothetical protein
MYFFPHLLVRPVQISGYKAHRAIFLNAFTDGAWYFLLAESHAMRQPGQHEKASSSEHNAAAIRAGHNQRIRRGHQAASLSSQQQAGIALDGLAGPETRDMLGGHFALTSTAAASASKMADLAMAECEKMLRWTGPGCEAEKYLAPMRGPMQKLGHIGTDPVFYAWCGSFVAWCARSAGIDIPDQPDGFGATMALVESWEYWAKQKQYWLQQTGEFLRGDIVLFKWEPTEFKFDHIGIVASHVSGTLMVYEGNRENQTAHGSRAVQFVAGTIRIAS